MISGLGGPPASALPLPASRLMARTVMSWSQAIWQERRALVTLGGENGALGGGHPGGLPLDELDAARRAARVAAARMQHVDIAILLDRQHHRFPAGTSTVSNPYHRQLRMLGILLCRPHTIIQNAAAQMRDDPL